MNATDPKDVLSGIYNYRQAAERMATAGQPTYDELEAVARAGYEVVVNLRLPGEEGALPDERERVEALGMAYIHAPVTWEQPTAAELERFFAVLDAHPGARLFIHCTANIRVSIFLALYRVHRHGWSADEAFKDVRRFTLPGFWWAFIRDALERDEQGE
jgi:uncharacterized protein (TIGR01244 family)